MLDEGYEIRFDGGKFDAETFNMQITNIEVLRDNKRYWNADAISLDTILLADGQTLIVKNLKIDSFVSSVDEVKVGSINVSNVTLDKYDHLLAGEIGSLLDHALDNAYLGIFDFWAPIERGAEYDIFVQSMELTPVRRTTLSTGNSYFNRIGMRGRPRSNTADCIIKIGFEALKKSLGMNWSPSLACKILKLPLISKMC